MFAALLNWIKKAQLLPRISDTERQALEAGSVWVDGEFFSGNPDFEKMLAEAYPKLPPEEQAFLDGPCEELFQIVDSYTVHQTRIVPDEVLDFIKEKGFMGLIIPKEYGGFGMSTLGRSAVMMKLTPLGPVSSFVVIANTLGAAELIIEYGTEEQKQHYLPKLAKGEYIPCFGLTEPTAGSDAASIKAEGEVFKDADGEVKIRLNFSKRYITLAPVANLISLAANLHDPDNLLGKGEHPGISVILLEKGVEGLEIGDHHEPIGPFDNGPFIGRDVIASPNDIIGGRDYAGQGWRMLMEALAGGRAVSLPAGGVAGCKIAAAATGPYSVVREQFGMPIGRMEGVETKVAHIAAMAYAMESTRVYACAAVDNGHHPPVVSAILKQNTTEMAQRLATDGLDVFAGAGVMQGPNNILGEAYKGAPVGITVEGANILTRTLIIYGQGATRCHPHALDVLKAVEEEDVSSFRKHILGWMGHMFMNSLRTVVRGLTRGWSKPAPVSGPTARYYRKLAWASARFAFLTDLAMFTIGGKLKQRGKLSGRFADALSWQFIGFATLRRFEAEGRREEDLPLVHYALEHSLKQVQDAFDGIYANFDVPVIGWLLRYPGRAWLRINPLSGGPSDNLHKPVSLAIQRYGDQYLRIIDGLHVPSEDSPGLGRLLKAFRLMGEAEPILKKIKAAIRAGELPRDLPTELVEQAAEQGVITAEEKAMLEQVNQARMAAIQVDVFSKADYYRPQLGDKAPEYAVADEPTEMAAAVNE